MKVASADCAIYAACAEAMFAPDVLTPELDERMAGWRIVSYLTALDALFGLQTLGLGERVFFGFVAQNNAEPADYVVVFRGTENALEWYEDARFLPNFTPAGAVVRGFWEIYASAHFTRTGDDLGEIAAIGIADLIPDGCTVTVIGHSLGAALATYMTRDLAIAADERFRVEGQFFASPKPGNARYAAAFDKTVGAANYQATNYTPDLVPHAPPIGYASLSNTRWLTADTLYPDNPGANHSVLNYATRLRAERLDAS